MNDARGTPEQKPSPDGLETYRRLVELQSQIVDLARRNTEAEHSCRLLRERLSQPTPRRSPGPLRGTLLRLFERIRARQAVGLRTAHPEGDDGAVRVQREQPDKTHD